MRQLATGVRDLHITRVDSHTLQVAQDGGFLPSVAEYLTRSPRSAFHVGERLELAGLSIEVVALTTQGMPAAVLARFDRDLASPELRFLRWDIDDYDPFVPPAIGASVTLPAADIMRGLLERPGPSR